MLTPLEELPLWRQEIVKAKRAAFAALPADEQKRAKEAQKAARLRAAQRKEAAKQLARTIYRSVFESATLEEIAGQVGRSPKAVRNVCDRWGLPVATRSFGRRLFAWVSEDRVAALDRVAADRGGTREQTLEDAMVFLLDDDGHALRRLLHVTRSPPTQEST